MEERALIVHYHGGGFIAMSSYSHQDYSRKWARQTGFPILSVDYRLAPAFPYPTPMNDCWGAYQWAVEQSHTILGARPERIVVTGDSAGGACTASVTLRAIAEDYRIPDGVLMSYPALNLYRYAMLPSRLLAFRDNILPFAFLDMVIRAYVPEHLILAAKGEPLLSPGHAPEEWLRRFPPAYIGVGDADPLFHDSIQFAHRLHRLRRPLGLSIYRGFPHGYLSFSALMRQASKIITETGQQLTNLATGAYHSEMMFAGEPPIAAAAPSPADALHLVFCRDINYARPQLGQFRAWPNIPQPVRIRASFDFKASETLYLWRKRYLEIRDSFLFVWDSDQKQAELTGCYLLHQADIKHERSQPKYITITAHLPDAKTHATREATLTLWSDQIPLISEWVIALQAASQRYPS